MKSNSTENQNANKDLVVHIGPRIECSDVSVIRNKQEIICCHIIEEVLYIFYYINVLFLAPIGAQEMLIFVRSCVSSFGSNLSRAVNLHLTGSEIDQSTQGAIREHLENT